MPSFYKFLLALNDSGKIRIHPFLGTNKKGVPKVSRRLVVLVIYYQIEVIRHASLNISSYISSGYYSNWPLGAGNWMLSVYPVLCAPDEGSNKMSKKRKNIIKVNLSDLPAENAALAKLWFHLPIFTWYHLYTLVPRHTHTHTRFVHKMRGIQDPYYTPAVEDGSPENGWTPTRRSRLWNLSFSGFEAKLVGGFNPSEKY